MKSYKYKFTGSRFNQFASPTDVIYWMRNLTIFDGTMKQTEDVLRHFSLLQYRGP
jgi:hypothetical protein